MTNAAAKKKKLLHFTTAWMDLKNIMLTELSQSVKENCHMISYVESDEHNKVTNKIVTEA